MLKRFFKVPKQLAPAASHTIPLGGDFQRSKAEPKHNVNSGFSKKNVLGGLIVSGIGLSVYSYFYDEERKKERQESLDTSHYLYHCIGGFDLYKLASILELGVLSKQTADKMEVPTSGVERAYFKKDRVCVTTPVGLQVEAYAGGN